MRTDCILKHVYFVQGDPAPRRNAQFSSHTPQSNAPSVRERPKFRTPGALAQRSSSHLQAVLHFTKLSEGIGEDQLRTYMQQFGNVAFLTMLPSPGTALVEMGSLGEAEAVIGYGQTNVVSGLGATPRAPTCVCCPNASDLPAPAHSNARCAPLVRPCR